MLVALEYDPPRSPLEILLSDDSIIVVNKPSGLLSVPGKSIEHRDCLETRLRAKLSDSLLVHRLDMDTSGVMIFARTADAQRNLGRQFEKRIIEKTYEACVSGSIKDDVGQIELPLIVDWPNRPLQKVDFDTGKPALTNWKVIERENNTTRVALFPKTGRSHQLRVHMQQIGHTILGDRFYGNDETIKAAPRLLLHSKSIRFRHPVGGEWKEVSVSPDF